MSEPRTATLRDLCSEALDTACTAENIDPKQYLIALQARTIAFLEGRVSLLNDLLGFETEMALADAEDGDEE